MIYKCECGKEFDKPNSFNAHKSNCKIHYRIKYGSDEVWNNLQMKKSKNSAKKLKENTINRKKEELLIWVTEKHICEKCGKVMTEKFGSGRFCSRSCANSKERPSEVKEKIGKSVHKEINCSCKFCGKNFTVYNACIVHERVCKSNPNINPNMSCITSHNKKMESNYKIDGNIRLNVSYNFVNIYLDEHTTCEICGRTVEQATLNEAKNRVKRLCIDHDHNTNEFRGVLCQYCNRQLGWYEKYKDAINNYLNKDYPIENNGANE